MQEPLNDDSPVMPWLVEHAGCILSKCQKGRDGKTPFGRLHGKRPTQEFVPFGEKVLARKITTDPMNRMNPDIDTEFGLECETTVQSVSSGMQTVCSELVKSGDWNLRTDGTQKQSTM